MRFRRFSTRVIGYVFSCVSPPRSIVFSRPSGDRRPIFDPGPTARNRIDDRQHIPRREDAIELRTIAFLHGVAETQDVSPQRSRVVVEMDLQCGLAANQLFERFAYRGSLDIDPRGTTRELRKNPR